MDPIALKEELKKVTEKMEKYQKKYKNLNEIFNEEQNKLDQEIKKAKILLQENNELKDNLMASDVGIQEREDEIKELNLYIDQLEATIKKQQDELTQKELILKQANHTKNSKSSNNMPITGFKDKSTKSKKS